MKKVLLKNWKEIIRVMVVVFGLSFVSVMMSGWLRTDMMQEKIALLGIWGPVVVILYVTASHIFAPLAGTPGVVAALSVYGPIAGWVYVYLASILSATINFYIARSLGRVWVVRLAGKESINRIDRFVNIMGTRLLIMARLFGFPVYEFVSYAAGFTAIPFSKYLAITALVSPIPGILFTFLTYSSLGSPWMMAIVMGLLIGIGAIFTWYTAWLYLKSERVTGG